MAAAVDTRLSDQFHRDRDGYGFVVEHTANARLRSLNRLIDWAKASPDGVDLERRFDSEGAAAAAEVKLRSELQQLTTRLMMRDRLYRPRKAGTAVSYWCPVGPFVGGWIRLWCSQTVRPAVRGGSGSPGRR